MTEKPEPSNLSSGFRKTLDSHGYGFQYAVLKKVTELNNARQSQWSLEIPELPVEARGQGTRIDFILRFGATDLLLVAECKRVNSAFGNWCFAAAPYVGRSNRTRIVVQRLVMENEVGPQYAIIHRKPADRVGTIYHVGLELRQEGEKGDAYSSGRQAIEDAATQVCRGLNGLVNFCARTMAVRTPVFLPAIFTTARLWVSDINLADADLATGTFPSNSGELKEVTWLLYQYNQSPGLKHAVISKDKMDGLEGYFYSESARTIAVVGASGIEDFLTRNWWEIITD